MQNAGVGTLKGIGSLKLRNLFVDCDNVEDENLYRSCKTGERKEFAILTVLNKVIFKLTFVFYHSDFTITRSKLVAKGAR